MKKTKKRKYSQKLKCKISTMHLGKDYYDAVVDSRKDMFGK